LVSALLLAMLLSMAGSRFLFAPGISVELRNPAAGDLPSLAPVLPRANSVLPGVPTSATLTVPAPRPFLLSAHSETMVFFEGAMFSLGDASLRAAMARALRNSGAAEPTLLLKMDGSVSMNRFFQLKAHAEEAGFVRIQIAGEDARSAPPPSPPFPQKQRNAANDSRP
jgi:biopolymer transport protein ExbD